jgi:hypothetical protein
VFGEPRDKNALQCGFDAASAFNVASKKSKQILDPVGVAWVFPGAQWLIAKISSRQQFT